MSLFDFRTETTLWHAGASGFDATGGCPLVVGNLETWRLAHDGMVDGMEGMRDQISGSPGDSVGHHSHHSQGVLGLAAGLGTLVLLTTLSAGIVIYTFVIRRGGVQNTKEQKAWQKQYLAVTAKDDEDQDEQSE